MNRPVSSFSNHKDRSHHLVEQTSPPYAAGIRDIWKKTAAVRLAVGAVLLAGSAVAAASWAVAIAWSIVALRAAMAGTGAFFTAEGILRTLGFSKNVAVVSLAVGIAIGAILAIPGAEAAEAVHIAQKANPSGDSLLSDRVHEVFSDIRADHPRQRCVTLEQCVRRIEWLARGVPLSQSARLDAVVPDAHAITCDPQGKIVRSMRELGFLPSSDESEQSSEALSTVSREFASEFNTVTRRLSESDIAQILEKAYGETAKEVLSPIGPPVRPPADLGIVGWKTPKILHATESPPPVPPSYFKKPMFGLSILGGIAALLVVPFWISRYRRSQKENKTSDARGFFGFLQKKTSSVDPQNPGISNERALFPKKSAPHHAKGSVDVSERDIPPIREVGSACSNTAVYPALRLAVSDILTGEYGFSSVPAPMKAEFSEFALPTPAGEFRAILKESGDVPVFRFAWLESGAERFSAERNILASSDPAEIRDRVRTALKDAYFDAAVFRENAKREEFRNLRLFEVSPRDLASIYRQLEDPETVSSNRETGGFWFGSGYSVKDGVFRFSNLANPLPEEIDATSVEFAIRYEKWETYVGSNISKAFRVDFSPGERKLFSSALERGMKTPEDSNPFALAVDFFNWHKHPGAPLGPSGADINHIDSAFWKFADSPALGTVTFVIANRIHSWIRESGGGLWNSCVLKGNLFWGKNDYLLTFWKLLRISDAEQARRKAFVGLVGIAKATVLWICDRNGRLLHLDHEVRTEAGIFTPDLRPVAVKTLEALRN